MKYLGNLTEDQVIDFQFNTQQADGTPITLAGTPSLAVYKDGGLTQSTAGLTLSVDFDSVTGLHNVEIDTSADAFYATGSNYSVVVAAGTVDGTSVVGTVLAEFSIQARYMRGTDSAATAANLDVVKTTIDTIAADVVNIDGAAMRGTDNAATASNLATAQTSLDSLLAALIVSSGTAQTGTATTIQLASGEPSNSNVYNYGTVFLTGGTGVGQFRLIKGYSGPLRVCTVDEWDITPDNTTTYVILPRGIVSAYFNADAYSNYTGDEFIAMIDTVLSANHDAGSWGPADLSNVALEATLTAGISSILARADVTTSSRATPSDITAAIVNLALEASVQAAIAAIGNVPSLVDTELTASHGSGSWQQAGVTGLNSVTICIEDDTPVPLPGVFLSILNSDESVLLTSGITDANGELILALDDGTYKVRLYKAGYSFTNPETLVVSGATTDTYTGVAATITPPSAGLQNVTGTITNPALLGTSGAVIEAKSNDANQIVTTAILDQQKLSDITVDGAFVLTLAKTGKFLITGKYRGVEFYRKVITVTSDDTKDLSTY